MTNEILLLVLCVPAAAIALGMLITGIVFKVDQKTFKDERDN